MDILTLLDSYVTLLQNNVMAAFLLVPLALVFFDIVTGVLVSLKQKIFDWKKLFTFLQVSIVPYLAIIAVVFVTYWLFGSGTASSIAIAFGMVVHGASVLGSIVSNLKELQASPMLIAEVEMMGTHVINDPWPVVPTPPPGKGIPSTASPLKTITPPPAYQQALPTDRQTTMVQPSIQSVPLPAPAPVPVKMPLVAAVPQAFPDQSLALLPMGL